MENPVLTTRREAARQAALNKKMPFMVSTLCFDHKPTKDEYPLLHESYRNTELDPFELLDAVARGASFSAWHDPEVKKKENWHSAQYVAVDLEKHPNAALDVLEAQPFYAAYCTFAYTTFSHTDTAPRSRVVFLLEEVIDDVEEWHLLARAVTGMFGAAADDASPDISRGFLGNPTADMRLYGNYLPITVAQMLAAQQQSMDLSRQRDREVKREIHDAGQTAYAIYAGNGTDPGALFDRWLRDVTGAPEGKRNQVLNRAAFLAGRYLVAKRKMSANTALSGLIGAGVAAGLSEVEVRRTVVQALEKGASS